MLDTLQNFIITGCRRPLSDDRIPCSLPSLGNHWSSVIGSAPAAFPKGGNEQFAKEFISLPGTPEKYSKYR